MLIVMCIAWKGRRVGMGDINEIWGILVRKINVIVLLFCKRHASFNVLADDKSQGKRMCLSKLHLI